MPTPPRCASRRRAPALPHRQLGLDGLDERAAGIERRAPVGIADRSDDRDVADRERADPVADGEPDPVEVRGDSGRDRGSAASASGCAEYSSVTTSPASVGAVVAHGPDEARDRTGDAVCTAARCAATSSGSLGSARRASAVVHGHRPELGEHVRHQRQHHRERVGDTARRARAVDDQRASDVAGDARG